MAPQTQEITTVSTDVMLRKVIQTAVGRELETLSLSKTHKCRQRQREGECSHRFGKPAKYALIRTEQGMSFTTVTRRDKTAHSPQITAVESAEQPTCHSRSLRAGKTLVFIAPSYKVVEVVKCTYTPFWIGYCDRFCARESDSISERGCRSFGQIEARSCDSFLTNRCPIIFHPPYFPKCGRTIPSYCSETKNICL